MTNTNANQKNIEALKGAIGAANLTLSLYFPKKINGHVLDTAFTYSSGIASKERTRPLGYMVMDNKTGNILEYRNAFINDFVDTEKYPLDMKLDYSIDGFDGINEFIKILNRANELYNDVREFAFNESLSDKEKAVLEEYSQCFFKVVPKALLPFYEALSPEFYGMIK